MKTSIGGQWVLKEPRDAPKRAKKNEIEGQSFLTLELSTMAYKSKRYEFLLLKGKGNENKFHYTRKKEKGKEIVPPKNQA